METSRRSLLKLGIASYAAVDDVLYAMDYPYQQQADEVVATDTVPKSYEDKKKLFQTNAETVFSL